MQAYIGGIVSMSTVDWPRNICTVIFFAGCDFRCPYCQNSEIVQSHKDHLRDIKEVKREIKKNIDFIDALLFSGGEACLQKHALHELGHFAKKRGLKVGIETNGTKPDIVRYLLEEKILDFVGLDIKAPLSDEELFNRATKSETFFKPAKEVIQSIKTTLAILKENQENVEIELRTTIVPRLVYRKEDVIKIAQMIDESGIECRWSLQQFRSDFGKVLDPMFKDIDNPKKSFIVQLKEHCLNSYPNLRIDVKAV